ncbi:MAG TPA: PASTA domain-containing protein, partial [Candidatus Limnocylindrales bacterium]|nr:PASTA domain-containing protein [Candidatus Limnocylindrales bacterium]
EPRSRRTPAWPWVAVLATLALLLGAVVLARSELGGGSPPPASSPSPSSSSSEALLTVPPVAGMRQDQAIQELSAAGFTSVTIVPVHQEDTDPNTVVRTDPPAGAAALPGTVVTVYVESPGHKGKGGGNG